MDSGVMKSPATKRSPRSRTLASSSSTRATGRIHPVITFPFRHPANLDDLGELYSLVARLDADKQTYARPITVMDCKTRAAMAKSPRHLQFRDRTVARHSDILDAWTVDTCQMWYSGLGAAFERGGPISPPHELGGEIKRWLVKGGALLPRGSQGDEALISDL